MYFSTPIRWICWTCFFVFSCHFFQFVSLFDVDPLANIYWNLCFCYIAKHRWLVLSCTSDDPHWTMLNFFRIFATNQMDMAQTYYMNHNGLTGNLTESNRSYISITIQAKLSQHHWSASNCVHVVASKLIEMMGHPRNVQLLFFWGNGWRCLHTNVTNIYGLRILSHLRGLKIKFPDKVHHFSWYLG